MSVSFSTPGNPARHGGARCSECPVPVRRSGPIPGSANRLFAGRPRSKSDHPFRYFVTPLAYSGGMVRDRLGTQLSLVEFAIPKMGVP